jgi:hypothetical protein
MDSVITANARSAYNHNLVQMIVLAVKESFGDNGYDFLLNLIRDEKKIKNRNFGLAKIYSIIDEAFPRKCALSKPFFISNVVSSNYDKPHSNHERRAMDRRSYN